MRNVIGVLVVSIFLSACAAGDGIAEHSNIMRRDSSGVSIVEARDPVWQHDSPWRIGSEPVASIGTVDGDESYLFDNVVSAHRLLNGRIVVADRQSGEIRYYSADREVARVAGGLGEGPGNFLLLGYVGLVGGDTVVAMDGDRPRLTFFDSDGNVLEVVDISTTSGVPTLPVGVSRAGSVLSFGIVPFDPADQPHEKYLVHLFSHASAAQPGHELVRIPWGEFWNARSGVGGSEAIPFAPRGVWTSGLTGFMTGAADTTEVLLWSGTGELQKILRWGGALKPVGDVERGRYRDHRLADTRNENARRVAERALGELPWPNYMPAYQSLLVDDLGDVWVELYRPSWDQQPRWTVIDSTGVWRGDVLLPERFRPTHIGEDFLLGVWRDDDDVEFVHEYRLTRSMR